MLEYSFNPFNNNLEDIDPDDLLRLRNISEGWYIDYKQQSLKIRDLAKHISAFANQYGGWLIIGVKESDDGQRTASEFIGVPDEDVARITRDVREASSAHVNPEILYEEKIIQGPIEKIGLVRGRSLVIIGIPMSLNTPHVHSSGRIFRRLSDQSKPKEEVDRFILDDLWKRGRDHKDKVQKFLTNIPDLPEVQSNSAWIHIYYKPADGQKGPESSIAFDDFVRIAKGLKGKEFGISAPLTSISTTVNGFIARQTEKNDPSLATLTFRWWHDGKARLDIPLFTYTGIEDFVKTHKKNKHAFDFCALVEKEGYSNVRIIDYSLCLQVAASLSNIFMHLTKLNHDTRDVYSCFTLRNVFHTLPYIDSRRYIERSKELSLPLTMDNLISFPSEPSEENMLIHKNENRYFELDPDTSINLHPYVFSITVIYKLFTAVGIVTKPEDIMKDMDVWGFDKMNYENSEKG